MRDGVLLARVAAPPVDGAANTALVRLIADSLDVPPSSVRLVAGGAARVKRIELDATLAGRVRARWPDLAL